jgi:hypothetical protein
MFPLAVLAALSTAASGATVDVLDFREAAILKTFENSVSFDPPFLDLSEKELSTTRARRQHQFGRNKGAEGGGFGAHWEKLSLRAEGNYNSSIDIFL